MQMVSGHYFTDNAAVPPFEGLTRLFAISFSGCNLNHPSRSPRPSQVATHRGLCEYGQGTAWDLVWLWFLRLWASAGLWGWAPFGAQSRTTVCQ